MSRKSNVATANPVQMTSKVVLPVGTVISTDVRGKTLWTVTGPGGRHAVTSDGRDWELRQLVDRPGPVAPVYRDRDLQRALNLAARRAGTLD